MSAKSIFWNSWLISFHSSRFSRPTSRKLHWVISYDVILMTHKLWRYLHYSTYKRLDSISTWHTMNQSQSLTLCTNHKLTWFWPITFQRARLRPTLVYINSTRISLHFAHMAANTPLPLITSSVMTHHSHIKGVTLQRHNFTHYQQRGLKCTKITSKLHCTKHYYFTSLPYRNKK